MEKETGNEEIIEVNDIVTVTTDVIYCDKEGNEKLKIKDCNGRVLFLFTDWDNAQSCILEINGIQTPFLIKDLKLKEKAPEPMPNEEEKEQKNPEPNEVLRDFVATIPRWSLGYVYQINRQLVAAQSLEEAIGIFRESDNITTIESIKLMDHDNALIQNEIPVIMED